MDTLATDRSTTDGRGLTAGEIVARLLRVAAHVSAAQTRRLRPSALSPSAFTVLLHLADAPDGRLQPCTLADRLAVSRPSMCGLIDGLQAQGLVARAPHGRDGRRVLVALSATGRKLLDQHRAGYEALLDDLLDGLSNSDRRRLVGLLRHIGQEA